MALLALPPQQVPIATPPHPVHTFSYPRIVTHTQSSVATAATAAAASHTHAALSHANLKAGGKHSHTAAHTYVSPVSAQMFTNPESYPNHHANAAAHAQAHARRRVVAHAEQQHAHAAAAAQQQQQRSRSMAAAHARHSPPHSARRAPGGVAFAAAAAPYPQMSPSAAAATRRDQRRGRSHMRQSSLNLTGVPRAHAHGHAGQHHMNHRSHSTQMRAHHGLARQHRASVPHIMYPADAVHTPLQQQQQMHAHQQRLKHLAALQQQENQRRARQQRRARAGNRGGFRGMRPRRVFQQEVDDPMRGPDQSLAEATAIEPKVVAHTQNVNVSLVQAQVPMHAATTATAVLPPHNHAQREVNPALLMSAMMPLPQHTETQNQATILPTAEQRTAPMQQSAALPLATNDAVQTDGTITPLSLSRKSSVDSFGRRQRRKSSSASTASSASSSSTDRGSGRSSASSIDSSSGDDDSTGNEDGVKTPIQKSKKTYKKGAKTAPTHKTKYYATPAYQAKPKIEEIPLPSFLKTDPRFKKATSGAKKAAAAVKDAAKGDANTKEGFDAAVVSSGEENAAKIQTAKKADQKPRHASLPNAMASTAASASLSQPPMLMQRSHPPPLTTVTTTVPPPPSTGGGGGGGGYRGKNVSPPWTPTNAAHGTLPATAAGLSPRHLPATSATMPGPLPRAASLPTSPLAPAPTTMAAAPAGSSSMMMPTLARGHTDPPMANSKTNTKDPTEDLFVKFVNNVRKYRASEAAANAAKAQRQQQQQHQQRSVVHGMSLPRAHVVAAATLPSPLVPHTRVAPPHQQQQKPTLPAHYSGGAIAAAEYTVPRHVNAMTYPGNAHTRAQNGGAVGGFDLIKAYAEFRDETSADDDAEEEATPTLPSLASVALPKSPSVDAVALASPTRADDADAGVLPKLPSLASLRL